MNDGLKIDWFIIYVLIFFVSCFNCFFIVKFFWVYKVCWYGLIFVNNIFFLCFFVVVFVMRVFILFWDLFVLLILLDFIVFNLDLLLFVVFVYVWRIKLVSFGLVREEEILMCENMWFGVNCFKCDLGFFFKSKMNWEIYLLS